MAQRIFFGAIAISIVFGLFSADAQLSSLPAVSGTLLDRGSFLPLALALVAMMAVAELTNMCRAIGSHPHQLWASVSCLALVIAPWFSAAGWLGDGPTSLEAVHLQYFLAGIAFLGGGFVALRRVDVTTGLSDVAATWLLIVYGGVLPSFLMVMRCDSALPGPIGAWSVLCIIIVCKVSDIGAYFTGSFIGRTPLIPHVSPKKSLEGTLGGIAISALVSYALFKIHSDTLPYASLSADAPLGAKQLSHIHQITCLYARMSWLQALIFGVVMSVFGQLGDLLESVFKRSAKVKDSAHLVPGFGGVLDMVDSPFAVAPIAWFLLTRWWQVL
jgi:phosphatidate cytidylyltransferase